ncbi:MAG: aminotransferase class I/II-fold pyridoxal phosphate-dependent enzyme [Actinomycetota bacterium]
MSAAGSSPEPLLLSPPDVGDIERDALLRAFDSGWIAPAGPELAAFERELEEWSGWPTVALSSGSAALHLALLAAGVGAGDDVLVSSFTFAATANAVTYTGARPHFIDSDERSWNIDADLVADELAERAARGVLPAAVIAVDLYGQCADYDRLVPLCAEYGVPLIEDAAEALGAHHRGRPAGTLGDVGLFSFNGNKIITTSGGGALLAPTTEVTDRARYLATQARQPAVHYEHIDVGFNYRMSNLLAALGRAQLSRLGDFVGARRAINEQYRQLLGDCPGLGFMPVAPWSADVDGRAGWNGWLTTVVFDTEADRDRVMAALDDADVESRPLWKPMHLQPVFTGASARVNGTSERLFRRGLCLPSGSALDRVAVERVGAIVLDAL